jgi:hypothetical protein
MFRSIDAGKDALSTLHEDHVQPFLPRLDLLRDPGMPMSPPKLRAAIDEQDPPRIAAE